MYLFFDTETTGVPKNYKASPHEVDNWPRVIQLAWAFYNEDAQLIASDCNLIYPNGWEIPTAQFWIEHGYSTEKSKAEGIRIETALDGFINVINETKYLIAHNIQFDLPIVQAEMIRAEMSAQAKPQRFCTMTSTTNLCKIQGKNKGYKWPKLEELHRFLFNEDFDGAHDALNDVKATAKCFFELLKREVIKP
jgi:DNA polymerase III subunit epsilon